MPAIARTSAFPNSTTLRGIHHVIFHNWAQRESVGDRIFREASSSQVREHVLTVGGGSLFSTKAEGAAINYGSLNEGFLSTFTYVDYADGFRITRRMYINDLYGSMEKHGAELGRMAHASKETLRADHFNNGFSTSYPIADGAALFSTAHVLENGTTFRNKPSTDSDLSDTSLKQGIIDFRDFRDGGGKRLSIKPAILLTAADNLFVGPELLESERTPETDQNAINAIRKHRLSHEVWDYLDDSDAWFLLAAKSDHELLVFNREDFWTEHIFDFDTKDVKFTGMFGESSGAADARGLYGNQGG